MRRIFSAAMIAAAIGLTGATASASSVNFDFSNPVPLAATQSPGAWYTDRYAPGEFDSFNFNGEKVLRHGIREADSQANRPGAFGSSFYNFQGRKYDLGYTGASITLSIDVWVDASWETADRYAGLWATTSDANGDIVYDPTIEYDQNGIGIFDKGLETQVISFDDSSDYDRWYNLSFTLTPGVGFEFFVDGSSVYNVADTEATTIDNVILNGWNLGETYDIYWDNFQASVIPLPSGVLMGLAGLGIVAIRRRRH